MTNIIKHPAQRKYRFAKIKNSFQLIEVGTKKVIVSEFDLESLLTHPAVYNLRGRQIINKHEFFTKMANEEYIS